LITHVTPSTTTTTTTIDDNPLNYSAAALAPDPDLAALNDYLLHLFFVWTLLRPLGLLAHIIVGVPL